MRGHWSGSSPIISQIICTGTCAAISSTNSTSPRPPTASTMTAARRSISSTSRAIMRGVKALDTRRRPGCACGGSMLRIDQAQLWRGPPRPGGDEGGAQLAGVGLPVLADGPHVRVLGDGPEPGVAGLGMPVDRRLPARRRSNWSWGSLGPRSRPGGRCPPGFGRRSRVAHRALVSRGGVVWSASTTPRRVATASSSVTRSGSMRRIISRPNSRPITAGPTSCRRPRRRRPG